MIEGLQPLWFWRLGFVLIGGVSFYGAMLAAGVKLKPHDDQKRRLSRMVWINYIKVSAVAGLAGGCGLFSLLR